MWPYFGCLVCDEVFSINIVIKDELDLTTLVCIHHLLFK